MTKFKPQKIDAVGSAHPTNCGVANQTDIVFFLLGAFAPWREKKRLNLLPAKAQKIQI